MEDFRRKLRQIRKNLLGVSMRKALKLWVKKRRAKRGYMRKDINRIGQQHLPCVKSLQTFIRKYVLGPKILSSHKSIQVLHLNFHIKQEIFLRKHTNSLTRDKETYWIQRYALGRAETDQIAKYAKVTQKKFEQNWKEYEDGLEKYLTTKSQGQFKDWI